MIITASPFRRIDPGKRSPQFSCWSTLLKESSDWQTKFPWLTSDVIHGYDSIFRSLGNLLDSYDVILSYFMKNHVSENLGKNCMVFEIAPNCATTRHRREGNRALLPCSKNRWIYRWECTSSLQQPHLYIFRVRTGGICYDGAGGAGCARNATRFDGFTSYRDWPF